jgi:hypothetical protein
MAGGKGTKDIATRYPCVDGLISGTTTQTGHTENLKAQSGSNVPRRNKAGISGL